MTFADVYADDNATPGELSQQTVQFRIVADADADVLLRVAAQLCLGNIAPSAGLLRTNPDKTIVMRFEIAGLTAATVDSICRKLDQLSTIRQVAVKILSARSR